MSEINVKVRLAANRLYDTKVCVDLNDTVLSLKMAICKVKEHMVLKLMVIMYCGNILDDDSHALYTYDLFQGATVHVFQKIKNERKSCFEPVNDIIVGKLARGFHSLLVNQHYRNSLPKLCSPEALDTLLYNHPGLVEDPVALTLFQHPELLMKINDYETIKNLAIKHPALCYIILHVTESDRSRMQGHMGPGPDPMDQGPDFVPADSVVFRPPFSSDEDDDLDDSSPASETNGQPFSRNVVLGEITAAQLASAIASVTAQQSQPSTSGASTSTGSMGNVQENVPSQQTSTELVLPTQLQIMRDMGLTNETVNIAALRLSNDLETAIDLVLSGFTNP